MPHIAYPLFIDSVWSLHRCYITGVHGEPNERSDLLRHGEEERRLYEDDKDRYYSPAGWYIVKTYSARVPYLGLCYSCKQTMKINTLKTNHIVTVFLLSACEALFSSRYLWRATSTGVKFNTLRILSSLYSFVNYIFPKFIFHIYYFEMGSTRLIKSIVLKQGKDPTVFYRNMSEHFIFICH